MASSSSNPKSNEAKKPKRGDIPPMPEKYKIYDIPQHIWDKMHSNGAHATQKTLIDLYNQRIKTLEEQNRRDEERNRIDAEIIQHRQQNIVARNATIAETQQKIADVFKDIENSLFIS